MMTKPKPKAPFFFTAHFSCTFSYLSHLIYPHALIFYNLKLRSLPSFLEQLIPQLRHLKLSDLSRARQGHIKGHTVVAEPEHVRGRLVLAELAADPLAHLVGAQGLVAALEAQKGADDLAVMLVLEAGDDGERDGRVGDQTLFDLQGVDVFAA